jgi:hypothetical protein
MDEITVDIDLVAEAAVRSLTTADIARSGGTPFAPGSCPNCPPETSVAIAELDARLASLFEGLAQLAVDVSTELSIVAAAHRVMEDG